MALKGFHTVEAWSRAARSSWLLLALQTIDQVRKARTSRWRRGSCRVSASDTRPSTDGLADAIFVTAEIDKTLKKVAEGVEAFEEQYQKIQQTTNQGHKEKSEWAVDVLAA